MYTDSETYKKYATARAKKSPCAKNCVRAFLVGGMICAVAEALKQLYTWLGAGKMTAGTLVSVTLIGVTAVLTGIGIFDRIAKFGGAGTLVPITGFANAVAAPAIDGRAEGFVLGVGGGIFSIAGPVVLYATAAGALYGVIYYVVSLFL